jgi:Putative DNA-binding domain
MTLLELQRKMAAAVMRPLTDDYGMRDVTDDGASVKDEAASFIKPNDRLTSFERLEIYNRQYWFRLISAFSEDFPGLCALAGDEKFDVLTVAYLVDNPSTSFTLRNLGSRLEGWLGEHPEWFGKRNDIALDVARLEWAHIEAFDNGERSPLTLRDMAALNEESIFCLQPHLRLLDLQYPVDDFVVKVHHTEVDSGAVSNAVTEHKKERRKAKVPAIRAKQIYLAVHRFDESVYYKRIEREAYLLLQAIGKGLTLGDALEAAFDDSEIAEDERPARIQEWFANWAELGWLCKGEPAIAQD